MSGSGFTIRAAGDVLLPAKYEPSKSLSAEMREAGSPADLTVVNLEVPLTSLDSPFGKFITIKSEPSCVEYLRDWDVDLVSLANNHVLDHGVEAARETRTCLEKVDIKHAGFGENLEEALAPVWLERNGCKIAFFSAASTLLPSVPAADSKAGIAPLEIMTRFEMSERLLVNPGSAPFARTSVDKDHLANLLSNVRRARAEADVVIIALHWGVPQQPFLAEYQQPLAHALVDEGADLILGHHPHVLHGVEIYKGSPILYSLGHLICDRDQLGPLTAEVVGVVRRQWHLSIVAQLHWKVDGGWDVSLIPIALDLQGFPHLADARQAESVWETIEDGSEGLAGELAFSDGMIHVQ